MKLEYHFGTGNLDPYEYDVSTSELDRALIKLAGEQVFATAVTEDKYDELCDEYEDALTDYFRSEAYEDYKEERLLLANPDAYYGVSRRD